MLDHQAIITKLGGIRSLARKLDHAHHTTVQGWYDRNRIPVEHWASVLSTATDADELTSADFMPEQLRPEQAAA